MSDVSNRRDKDSEAERTYSDPHHLITTGGEGHFYKRNEDIGYWLDGQWISDYNYNGQGVISPGELVSFDCSTIFLQLVKTSTWT